MKIVLLTLLIVTGIARAVSSQESVQSQNIDLSTAIDRALSNATATRKAKESKEIAATASSLLSSDYLPQISSSLSYTHSQYPQIVTPIRQQGVFPPLDDQIYEASVYADWEIFDFGESRAARQSAQALADAANVKYDLARMEIIETTASGFVQLQSFKEKQQVDQQRIRALKQTKSNLESLHREGRVAKVDLLKIEDTIIEAEASMLSTESNIAQTLQVLSHNMGLEESLNMNSIHPISFEQDLIFDPEQFSIENAPGVAAAKEIWKASLLEAKASKRGYLPKINLFAAEQLRTGSDFEIDDQWMVGVRLNVPIFSGKKIVSHQIMEARARENEIKLEETRQQYVQQLNKLANAQFEALKRIEASQARSNYLEETYRVEQTSYREGRTTMTDLLTTESKLNGVRAELIALRSQLRIINLNIAVLTGELNKQLAIKLAEGKSI